MSAETVETITWSTTKDSILYRISANFTLGRDPPSYRALKTDSYGSLSAVPRLASRSTDPGVPGCLGRLGRSPLRFGTWALGGVSTGFKGEIREIVKSQDFPGKQK